MNRITDHFKSAMKGYDKNQVDHYIQKVTDEYHILQNQFEELFSKYDNLMIKYDTLKKQPTANMDTITKALADAETKAGQIVVDARKEATHIIESMREKLQEIELQKSCMIAEVDGLTNKIYGLISAAACLEARAI